MEGQLERRAGSFVLRVNDDDRFDLPIPNPGWEFRRPSVIEASPRGQRSPSPPTPQPRLASGPMSRAPIHQATIHQQQTDLKWHHLGHRHHDQPILIHRSYGHRLSAPTFSWAFMPLLSVALDRQPSGATLAVWRSVRAAIGEAVFDAAAATLQQAPEHLRGVKL